MSQASRLRKRTSRYNLKPVKQRGQFRARKLTDFSVPMLRRMEASGIKTLPESGNRREGRVKELILFRIRVAIFAKRNARMFRNADRNH